MRSRLVLLGFLFCFSLSANAAGKWSYRAFGGQKLRLQKNLKAGDAVLLLTDGACQAPRFDGLELKHKISSRLSTYAWTYKATRTLNAEDWSKLTSNPCVHAVTGNPSFHIVQTTSLGDPLSNQQTALSPIGLEDAEKIFYHPLFGITRPAVVAVIDTGIQAAHPDLSSRLWRDDTGANGYDFVNDDADPEDDNGHGTHLAGIIAAQQNNGVGVLGIAGVDTLLMAVKTQDANGGGSLANLVNGIHYAVDHGAEVINLSIAGRVQDPTLQDALEYAVTHGVVVVVASGNDGQEITADNFIVPIGYAPSYAGVIGVGAFDVLNLSWPSYSNYSPSYVEIAAPGSSGADGILSTYLNGEYRSLAGTSMAAPHVSGAAALAIEFLKTQNQSFTAAEIEDLIEQAAVHDSGLSSEYLNGNRLDLDGLAHELMHATVLDSGGGFDEP